MRNAYRLFVGSITTLVSCACVLLGTASLEAQTVTTLHRFTESDGTNPYYGFTVGPDGTLYGTAAGVGIDGEEAGSVFKLQQDGSAFTVIHTFNPTSSSGTPNSGGANPLDGPILDTDGNLYGVTGRGGVGGYGVVYSVTTNGQNYTVLYQFTATETGAEYQSCGVVRGSDGYLYGSGDSDGINNWDSQIYKIDTNGANYGNLEFFTYSAGGANYNPLLPGRNGNLYGVTGGDPYDGSPNNVGTIFMLTTGGTYTDLHDLADNDGQLPDGGLIEDTHGTLYGSAAQGGTYGQGTAFHIGTNGENFTVIHNFGNGSDGTIPIGRLLLATDGYLYGSALEGGEYGYGALYRMSTNGANYQVLYNFTGNVGATGDHGYPTGCLIEAASGEIFGMCGDEDYDFDPTIGNGSIFKLTAVAPSGTGVQSINRVAASPTNTSTVQWTVTFGASVTGVTSSDFELVSNGLSGSPAITGVSGSGTTYTVTASTGSGTGTLQLNLGSVAGVSPSITNTLPFDGQTYTIDLVPPTVTISQPSVAGTTNGPSSSVTYTVSYYDANFNAATLNPSNISLTNNSVTASVNVTQNNATNFTVTLSDLSGVGSQAIQIAAGTASDLAGNLAPAAGPSASFNVTNYVPPVGPTVTISSPNPPTTVNGSVAYTVTISDPNLNEFDLNPGAILVNATGTASASVNTSLDSTTPTNAVYTVTLGGISGSGSLSISIASDVAQNSLGGISAPAGPSFPVVVDLWPYHPLYSFTNGTDGNIPQGGLTLAGDGNFYGVTLEGGDGSEGTIFRISTNGALSVLYPFDGFNDGGTPHAGLTLADNGLLYGTSTTGGSNNAGTIFSIATNGAFQVIYAFSSSGFDGSFPDAPMIQAVDGFFYGTTSGGGSNLVGNVFRVATNGAFTNIYSFSGLDGYAPMAPLFQASDGNFYGTASLGGAGNQGTIFQITPAGNLTTLHSFSALSNLTNDDGAEPLGGLVQGRDGGLYGVTSEGGFYNGGTLYRITTNGAFSVLRHLNPDIDGADSSASLIVGSDGNLYGSTQFGSPAGNGSIFQATTNGALTVLYSFVGGSFGDGAGLTAPVTQAPNGDILGASPESGLGQPNGAGSLFALINPNPAPVISAQPASQSVPFDGVAVFSVTVDSSAPVLYQWSFDGAIIAGATNNTLQLTDVDFTNAGSYAVTVVNSNAIVVSASAQLVVTQAAASITLNGLGQIYDGAAESVTATTAPDGLEVALTYNGSAAAPTNAGSYTIIATVNDIDYEGSVTNTLVVSNAPLYALANNAMRYVNQPNPTFTGSLVGAVPSDGLSLSFSNAATITSPAGVYPIVPVINDPAGRLANYNVTITNGALTVVLGEPAITPATNSIFYTLNQSPALLLPSAVFAAPSSPTFAGGRLSVQIVTNAGPLDLLSIQSTGNGPGQIAAALGSVTFGGTNIASYSGGEPELDFTFDAAATAPGVQALLGSLTFQIDATATTNLSREIELTLDDGNSLTSSPVFVTVIINRQPVVQPYHTATGTNTPAIIPFSRLLTNASDPDGDPVAILQVQTNSLQGGVIATNETSLVYTPPTNFTGLDSFSYTVTDGRTGVATGSVYVLVLNGQNLAIVDSPTNSVSVTHVAVIGLEGIASRTYRVQGSDDLINWINLGSVLMPDTGYTNFFDTNAISFTYRFYRTVYP